MLALFGQMERTYALERAAHVRAVAHLPDQGLSIAEIVQAPGITRSSLYRHLPTWPPETLTAENQQNA